MPESTLVKRDGLLDALAAFAATLVAIVQTRIELLAIDLEEGGRRWLALLLMVQVALFCLGLGLMLASVLLITAYWDSHRLLVLGLLAATYLLSGLAVLLLAMFKVKTMPGLFAASLSELAEDGRRIVSR